MAKKRFAIAPKLKDQSEKQIKHLPVQEISVEDIEKIAVGEKTATVTKKTPSKTVSASKSKKALTSRKKKAVAKRPQGRPRRTEPIKRLSSDLPADLYDMVKEEVRNNGYSLNGFLAKVIREYFERKKD